MSGPKVLERTGEGAVSIMFGVAESFALMLSGFVLVILLIISQVVRVTQESAENRTYRRMQRDWQQPVMGDRV